MRKKSICGAKKIKKKGCTEYSDRIQRSLWSALFHFYDSLYGALSDQFIRFKRIDCYGLISKRIRYSDLHTVQVFFIFADTVID